MNIFVTYGIRSLTIDAIAIHIPISKKDLLKIAKNKEELIIKIFEYRATVANNIAMNIQQNPEVTNAIDVMLHMSVLMSKACNEFNPQLDFEFKKYYPTLFSDYEQQKHEHIIDSMTNIFQRGQQEGVFKSKIDAYSVAQYYFDQVQKHHESFNHTDFSRETIKNAVQLLTEFVHSISTDEGNRHFDSHKKLLHNLIDEWDKNIHV